MIAVDVPSGVNAGTGEVDGACVQADVTVTFHAAKVGLCTDPGKSRAGRVQVVQIGIPPELPAALAVVGVAWFVWSAMPQPSTSEPSRPGFRSTLTPDQRDRASFAIDATR